MAYKVKISPRAQREVENAIDYYSLYSIDAPQNFISALRDAFQALERGPLLRIRYKHIRALKIQKFPYLLFFVINEEQKTVNILSCFHVKRNPKFRPSS